LGRGDVERRRRVLLGARYRLVTGPHSATLGSAALINDVIHVIQAQQLDAPHPFARLMARGNWASPDNPERVIRRAEQEARRRKGRGRHRFAFHGTCPPTRARNLVSLCRFHHRRHHEGRFRIEREASGDFTFTAEDGRPLVTVVAQPASGRLDLGRWNDSELARARDGGAPFDRDYAVAVMADGIAFNRAASARVRAGPAT
jgi:hypothetical protein